MYVIYNKQRNAYKTDGGWTTITRTPKATTMDGLSDVIRFTTGEAISNAEREAAKGNTFVYFPLRRWCDL